MNIDQRTARLEFARFMESAKTATAFAVTRSDEEFTIRRVATAALPDETIIEPQQEAEQTDANI